MFSQGSQLSLTFLGVLKVEDRGSLGAAAPTQRCLLVQRKGVLCGSVAREDGVSGALEEPPDKARGERRDTRGDDSELLVALPVYFQGSVN